MLNLYQGAMGADLPSPWDARVALYQIETFILQPKDEFRRAALWQTQLGRLLVRAKKARIRAEKGKNRRREPESIEVWRQRESTFHKLHDARNDDFKVSRPDLQAIRSRLKFHQKKHFAIYLMVSSLLYQYESEGLASRNRAAEDVSAIGNRFKKNFGIFSPNTTKDQVLSAFKRYAPAAHLIFGFWYTIHHHMPSEEDSLKLYLQERMIIDKFDVFVGAVLRAQRVLQVARAAKTNNGVWDDVEPHLVTGPEELSTRIRVEPSDRWLRGPFLPGDDAPADDTQPPN